VHEDVTEHLHQTARYHRAHLHQALLENLPRNIIRLRKKLVSTKVDPQEGVTLEFEDGTIATADILLGADGLHSVSFWFHSGLESPLVFLDYFPLTESRESEHHSFLTSSSNGVVGLQFVPCLMLH